MQFTPRCQSFFLDFIHEGHKICHYIQVHFSNIFTASVINCPTVGLNFLDSEVITWTEPSVSGGTRVSQTHFPGISEFPLGTTVVMYQFAVPGSTQLLTCAFPVTVTRDPNSAGLYSPSRIVEKCQQSSTFCGLTY